MFTYTLKLNTNRAHHEQLEKRFRMADDIYQKTLRQILKRVRNQKKDPLYKKAYKLPKGTERNAILKELDQKYDLCGSFTFDKFANNYRNQRNYARYIPSHVAGKLGVRAWNAYLRVKFAKGAKRINLNQPLLSFEAKSDNSIIIRNGILKMGTKGAQFECPVKYNNDDYEREVFSREFKFNRIVRKFQYGRWHYYVQMIFDGTPPQKHVSTLQSSVGIDIGTSTIATSSYYQTELRELAANVSRETDHLRRLQRKLDRQRRTNNPQNYNENGTIKTGRKSWNDSKEYLKTKQEISEILRKRAAQRKLAHQTLANEIVQMGDRFVVEQMSFKGLQARTKETTISEKTGRFKRKARFGKTILNHAPAMLIEMLRYKALFQNKDFIIANTHKIKASQLDHVSGQYNKLSLSTRTKTIDEELVQRDLYAAFILQHVEDDRVTINLEDCDKEFANFVRNQNITMANLETTLQSTGLKRFNKL